MEYLRHHHPWLVPPLLDGGVGVEDAGELGFGGAEESVPHPRWAMATNGARRGGGGAAHRQVPGGQATQRNKLNNRVELVANVEGC